MLRCRRLPSVSIFRSLKPRAGKSAVVSSHPLNVGGIGETGCLAANLLAPEADLIIGIGTRYTDFTTSSKSLFKHGEVTFLNLNISPADALKLDGVPVLADAGIGPASAGRCPRRLSLRMGLADQ